MALIFEPDSSVVRRGVEGLVDVASLVHTVYMIVSHDWLDGRSAARGSIAIIVHCVQESSETEIHPPLRTGTCFHFTHLQGPTLVQTACQLQFLKGEIIVKDNLKSHTG